MDWAVVDSLPYLYYLQYKTYQRLARYNDQQRALNNLMLAISVEPNLGHRETVLNLLGQCLEQENRYDHALQCYFLSLNIRPRNNAANFHVFRLLYRAFIRG
jgi:tetratricopeptide (TPR) repeat protein